MTGPTLVAVVIDDDQDVGETLCEALQNIGLETLFCADPRQGLVQIEGNCPDLVLIDYGLGALDGMAIASEVHAKMPSLPIVLTTGWLVDFEEGKLSEAGISRVVRKPATLEELREVVQLCVRRSSFQP